MTKITSPFFVALKNYVNKQIDSWHTPGHSGGNSYKQSKYIDEFRTFMSNELFRSDLSVSVGELDSLLESSGVVQQSQEFAAKTFGSQRTFYVTNGSSTSNKIILQSLVSPGDKILLDRNSHMSAHQGIFLSGAKPIYIDSTPIEKYGLFGPIKKSELFTVIKNNPDAKLLFLTSCTYDGLRYDLRPIIKYAHNFGIKVIIDEAWYAFAKFHPQLRPTALESGADYVTHSIHKVLTALSQASMIHINDPDFDERRFLDSYSLHTSSSPSYPIIASLDVATFQVRKEGFDILDRTISLANYFREKIKIIKGYKTLDEKDLIPEILSQDNILLDPTKVTIDISMIDLTADLFVKKLLNTYLIQIEKYTHNTITILFSVGSNLEKTNRLIVSLGSIAKDHGLKCRTEEHLPPKIPKLSEFHYLPRDAFFQKGEFIKLYDDAGNINEDLAGRIALDMVIPKPPGIPVLIPGQKINYRTLDYICKLKNTQTGIRILGLREKNNKLGIQVLKTKEARNLTSLTRVRHSYENHDKIPCVTD